MEKSVVDQYQIPLYTVWIISGGETFFDDRAMTGKVADYTFNTLADLLVGKELQVLELTPAQDEEKATYYACHVGSHLFGLADKHSKGKFSRFLQLCPQAGIVGLDEKVIRTADKSGT